MLLFPKFGMKTAIMFCGKNYCSVIDRDLNSAGRGLNLVVIDSKTHQVMRTGHYDTYSEGTFGLLSCRDDLSEKGGQISYVGYFRTNKSVSIFPYFFPKCSCSRTIPSAVV